MKAICINSECVAVTVSGAFINDIVHCDKPKDAERYEVSDSVLEDYYVVESMEFNYQGLEILYPKDAFLTVTNEKVEVEMPELV